MVKLSDEEIRKRLIELRNLKYLYGKAKKRIASQDKTIKFLKLRVKELEEKDKQKDKIIESLMLQLEDIKIKVFGKKNNKDDKNDDATPKTPKPRDNSSYQRRIPNDSEVT
ncbi:MAG TPA: hypothetical protein DHT43_01150, partial [Deltaproteobacteria bacterium]|nr:hypothetical protein [Deltaproteobacteria bacterium]